MEFRTKVEISKSDVKINHDNSILLLGSCFSDSVGEKLKDGGFTCQVNPLGTLYNPASIATAIKELLKPPASSLLPSDQQRDSSFFGWLHSKADFNATITYHTDFVIITFGTAWIYRLKETGMVVANCRKQPDNLFSRSRMDVGEIVDIWTEILSDWHSASPDTKFLFTVSPIRHKRDGLHENQLSKATLLLAIDRLCKQFPDYCIYFPAYELLIDELRDYRFCADDMVHPSSVAVDYIWERFQDTFFTPETHRRVLEAEKQNKQGKHIPICTK